jgi:Pyridoxamine 5'-phosphate oxidase
VRTVALRGMTAERVSDLKVRDEDLLTFISDSRSGKADDLRADAHAEIALFFSGCMTQVRCSGVVNERVLNDVVRWDGLTERERRWFAWPPPGRVRVEDDGTEDQWLISGRDLPREGEKPACFRVFAMHIDFVEILDLTTMPYTRAVYQMQSDGVADTPTLVNP